MRARGCAKVRSWSVAGLGEPEHAPLPSLVSSDRDSRGDLERVFSAVKGRGPARCTVVTLSVIPLGIRRGCASAGQIAA